MHRREVLISGGVALTTALAGCGESETSDRETESTDNTDPEENGDTDGDSNSTEDEDNGGESEEELVELLNHEWYNEGQFNAGVRGQVENVSGKTLNYVEVSVYFLDSEGVQFSESIANTSDLAEGRVWEFDAMFTGDDASRVENYEIETSVSDY